MQEYVSTTIIYRPRKQRKRLRTLATFANKPSTTREGKRREQELSNTARNVMPILQAHGITAQTLPYALAIANIHGNMHSSRKVRFQPCFQAVYNLIEQYQQHVASNQ